MKIGIIGLGLIGGSLGFDFRQLGHTVFGVARKPATCEAAIARGAVDQASTSLASMQTVEVVFICTPIAVIESTAIALIPYLQPETVITDVGSVKGAIVYAMAQHWPYFVGGHPMAGKTEVGVTAAESHLFADRAYVITPTQQTPDLAIATVKGLAQSLQAKVFICSPEVHDRAVSWISHLPVMISSSLIQSCLHEPDPQVRELAQQFASSGFRDTSRVGGGHPELGVMMARYNQAEVLRSLQAYGAEITRLAQLIQEGEWETIAAKLAENHHTRPRFLE
ncbi:MAG: prephenate/arogenate dehydrogenase [Cyanobacteria bacterium P01_F01_bin.86]